MVLVDALLRIEFDSNWKIYAEINNEGCLERYSDAIFLDNSQECGLENYFYVCSGDEINYFLSDWADDGGELVDGWFEEFIEPVNDEIRGELD